MESRISSLLSDIGWAAQKLCSWILYLVSLIMASLAVGLLANIVGLIRLPDSSHVPDLQKKLAVLFIAVGCSWYFWMLGQETDPE